MSSKVVNLTGSFLFVMSYLFLATSVLTIIVTVVLSLLKVVKLVVLVYEEVKVVSKIHEDGCGLREVEEVTTVNIIHFFRILSLPSLRKIQIVHTKPSSTLALLSPIHLFKKRSNVRCE